MSSLDSGNLSGSLHILVFPYPAQGHILPLLKLTRQLLALRQNLSLTILVTPKNLPVLKPLLSAHPFIQTLVLPFPHHPSLPSGVENVREIGNHGNVPIINALANLHEPIFRWFKSHLSPPVAIISDFFLGWTQNLAAQLGIPRIAFFSSSSYLTSVNAYFLNNDLDRALSLPVVKFDTLPGTPSFKHEHLPSILLNYKKGVPELEFVKDGILANFSSWGCVFNSFHALEGKYLEHLKKVMGHDRVWGVGPPSVTTQETVRKDAGSDWGLLTTWLDRCPDASAIYICFGSQKRLKNQQMEALASGLERSGTRFVWVVNQGRGEDGCGVIPEGFEERVGERGLIIKGWAPQELVLSHRAVRGFVSHCGWNSVLEAIVAGVMVLAWPMEADQYVNARLLVEEKGVAVRVCEGGDTVPDSGELAEKIANSVEGCETQRRGAEDLRRKALEAVQEGGSSARDLHALIEELAGLRAVSPFRLA